MNNPCQNSATPCPEMLNLNLEDLNIEELERRLELVAALPSGLRTNNCANNVCGVNCNSNR